MWMPLRKPLGISIQIKDPSTPEKMVESKPADVSASQAQAGERSGPSALTVGAIAVGAAAVVGGAVLLANSGGGSSDDSGDGGKVQAGTYVGSVTECSSIEGMSSSCSSHGMSIDILDTGILSSDSLREGMSLQGPLRGSDFTLIAPLTGVSTGEVIYTGTVVDQKIVGSITGSSQSSGGRAVYSGTFTATKN